MRRPPRSRSAIASATSSSTVWSGAGAAPDNRMEPLGRLRDAIADRYHLEREVGQGGMATVYLAEDLKHGRKVAIKVLRPELAAVIGAERFVREIRTVANLQHPHILGLIDSGEVGGTAYYVMPFVEGEALRDRLTREKQLPVDEAVQIAREVAQALDYAHRHHVVHRDIKPENILLHEGQALVADFGIALAVSRSDGGTRMTETGMSLGTPHYMAPEQAMGEREITAKADVYALGCVKAEGPRSLPLQRKTIPPHVEAAVQTALAKLPADRFAGAAQFAEALAGASQFTGTPPRAGGAHRARPPRSRDPLVLGLAAIAVLSLVAVAILLRRPAARQTLGSVRFLFRGSASTRLVDNFPWPAAISPDGNTLVYSVASPGGAPVLYARHLA